MFLFYTTEVNGDKVILKNEEHSHCTTVLRKKPGDIIYVTDGKGHIFNVQIILQTKSQTEGKILETTYQHPLTPEIAIVISPTKNASRLEWFLEKATEIGISAIYVTLMKRTEKKSVNVERLEKILVSAMKQSLHTHLPQLHTGTLKEIMQMNTDRYQQKFIAHCDNPELSLKNIYKNDQSAILLIGPEGDFTSDEISEAAKKGFKEVSLGPMRLRTETAGLTGLFMMRYSKL